jgi:pimeloyl-ACP methyl ester carboxylesterase
LSNLINVKRNWKQNISLRKAYTERFICVNGIDIHLVEKGVGFPVILVHGFASCFYTWRNNINALSKFFKVYAIDLPGFGFSDKPVKFPYNFIGYNTFLKNFMNTMSIDNAHFIGHSFGGAVCMSFSVQYSTMVRKMILISSRYNIDGVKLDPAIMKNLLLYTYNDSNMITEEMVDLYRVVNSTPNAKKIEKLLFRDFNKCSNDSKLNKLRNPCLIIWGKEDRIFPNKVAFDVRKLFIKADVRLIPDCGHAPHEEKYFRFNKTALDFLVD